MYLDLPDWSNLLLNDSNDKNENNLKSFEAIFLTN